MIINTYSDTEKAILDAATELFLDQGFQATSTTQIAKKAGLTQAMVHYYFRTKDRLFNEVFIRKFKGVFTQFLEISNEDIPFEEKLRQKIESHFEMFMANPKLPLLFAHELNSNPARLAMLKAEMGSMPQQMIADFERELEVEIEAGRMRKMKAIDVIFNIVGLNMALFIVGPILRNFANISEEYFEGFMKHRKKENVHAVLMSLRPNTSSYES